MNPSNVFRTFFEIYIKCHRSSFFELGSSAKKIFWMINQSINVVVIGVGIVVVVIADGVVVVDVTINAFEEKIEIHRPRMKKLEIGWNPEK